MRRIGTGFLDYGDLQMLTSIATLRRLYLFKRPPSRVAVTYSK